MIRIKIVKERNYKELEKKVNDAMVEIQKSGFKILDTDIAGYASDMGEAWIMSITYEDLISE